MYSLAPMTPVNNIDRKSRTLGDQVNWKDWPGKPGGALLHIYHAYTPDVIYLTTTAMPKPNETINDCYITIGRNDLCEFW